MLLKLIQSIVFCINTYYVNTTPLHQCINWLLQRKQNMKWPIKKTEFKSYTQ